MDIEQKQRIKRYIHGTVCLIMLSDLEESKSNLTETNRNYYIDEIIKNAKIIIPYLMPAVDHFTIKKIGKHIFQINRFCKILKESYTQFTKKIGQRKRIMIRDQIENHICYIRDILISEHLEIKDMSQ